MKKSEQITVANGVRLTSVFAERFKRDVLAVYLAVPLKKETAAENALLARVLTHGSERFPDLYRMNRELDRLYGARLSSHVSKLGETQILTFTLTAIKGRFTFDGKDIGMECVRFLLDVLLHPAFENGTFAESVVESERRSLIDDINGLINDKNAYAGVRMTEEMCRGEAYGIRETGTAQDVKAVTKEALTAAWKRVVSEARIEIITVGEADRTAAAEAAAQAFSGMERAPYTPSSTDLAAAPATVRRVTEEMNVEQGKLAIGLRTGLASPRDTLPLVYANCIFGSGVSSKLFLIVREQMHLCYYCYSRPEVFKGLLTVQSGVDVANAAKAEQAILEQLEAVKRGDFTQKDMDAARVALRNAYLSTEDDPAQIASWFYKELFRGENRSPKEVADRLDTYTKDDLVRAFAGVTPDTVYLLRGAEK